MRKPLLGAVLLALVAGLGVPAIADGLPSPPVLRSEFVPNVPLAHLDLTPTAPVPTPDRPIDGRIRGWDVGVDAPQLEGTTVVQAGGPGFGGGRPRRHRRHPPR